MLCETCGRSIVNEEANFCEYCGTGLRGQFVSHESVSPSQDHPISSQNTQPLSQMTTAKWVIVMVLPFIPVIGIFAFLFLLFFWAFGHTMPDAVKSWARALLIVAGCFFVYMLYYLSTDAGQAIMNSYMSLLGGTAQ